MYNLEIYKVCRLQTNIKIKNTKCILQLTLLEDGALLISISKTNKQKKKTIFSPDNVSPLTPVALKTLLVDSSAMQIESQRVRWHQTISKVISFF